MFRKSVFATVASLVMSGPVLAQTTVSIEGLPSVSFSEAPLISPTDANAYYALEAGAFSSPTISVDPRDPRIQRMADSLDNDAWRIYEYVKNSIEITPQFGLQKGAFGAMLDGYGNPFDQANLMVELLREAGKAASYQYGEIEFSGSNIAEFTSWMGPSTARGACELLSGGGIPAIVNGDTSTTAWDCTTYSNLNASLTSVRMSHVWVVADLGNGARAYDPSFKRHTWTQRSAILDTLPSAATYQSATGGAFGTYNGIPAITGLDATSVTSLETQLNTATGNLVTQLQQPANMNQSLVEIVGGARIDEEHLYHLSLDAATTSHPYQAAANTQWVGEIPTALRAKLTIDVQLRIGGTLVETTLDVADVAGRRMMLAPFSLGGNASAIIWLDEELLLQSTYDSGCSSCMVTGFGTLLGLTINHPYASMVGNYMDDEWRQPVSDISSTVIFTSWGDNGLGLENNNARSIAAEGQIHRQPFSVGSSSQCYGAEVQAAVNSAPSPVSPAQIEHQHVETVPAPAGHPAGEGMPIRVQTSHTIFRVQENGASPSGVVIGGCLPTFEEQFSLAFFSAQSRSKSQMSESWLARSEDLLRIMDGLSEGRHLTHHGFGVATSRADIGNDNSVREDQALLSVTTRVSFAPMSSTSISEEAFGHMSSSGLSALEGAIVKEVSGATDTNSTASMFEWYLSSGNVPSGGLSGGSPIFLLLNSSNFDTAFPSTFEYSDPVAAYADVFAQSGFDLIFPLSGRLGPSEDSIRFVGENVGQLDYWRRLGSAYIAYTEPGIGGFDVAHMTGPACSTERYGFRHSISCLRLPLKGSGAATFSSEINGPTAERKYLDEQYDTWASSFSVNVSNGGMTFSPPADIETGAGGFPYSLAFQRTYNSASNSAGPLGNGWSHNLEARIEVGSDIRSATNGHPQSAVATIVAADAVLSLFENGGDQIDMIRALLIQNWWAESLVNNSISIQRGSGSEQFYRLPSGGFVSTPGSQTILTQAGVITIDEEIADYAENTPETWVGIAYQHHRAFDYSALGFTYETADGVVETYTYGADRTRSSGILPVANDNALQEIGSYNSFLRTQTQYPYGVTVTYDYSGETWPGALTSVSNNLGRSLSLDYTYTDPLNPAVEPTPGSASHGPAYILSSVTDENGFSVSFGFDTTNLLHNGRHLSSATLPDTNTYSYVYAPQHAWSASGGSGTPFSPLTQQHLLSEVRLPHAPTAPFFTFGYDELGRLLTVTDADGDTTTYGVGEGARGFTQDPLGNESWSYFDQDGRAIASLSPRGIVSESDFDGIGRVTETRTGYANLPDNHYEARSSQTYDAFSNVLTQTAHPRTDEFGVPMVASAITTSTAYNHPPIPTLPTRVIDAEGHVSVTCYSTATNEPECAGRPMDANDRGGLPQVILGPSGEETLIEYDGQGRVTRTRTRVSN